MENRCRYTRINGARCTMPALNQGELCFEHEQRKRLARLKRIVLPETNAAGPLVSFAYMDDHASILANLNAITQAFANQQIDFRQVTALTYLMQTCLKTLRQMKELETSLSAEEVVREVDYDDSGMALAADRPAAADSSQAPIPGIFNHLPGNEAQVIHFHTPAKTRESSPIVFKHLRDAAGGTPAQNPRRRSPAERKLHKTGEHRKHR